MEISVIEREIEDLIQSEKVSSDVKDLAKILKELLEERRWSVSYETVLREIEVRFEAADKRFEALMREMNARFNATLQEIGALRREMEARFEAMNERFEAMDRRFESLQREMNTRFNATLQEIGALRQEMNTRFESLESRFKMLLWLIPVWLTAANWLTVLLLKLLKLI
jgi:HAMP domain-containing protein